jgi:BirA family biotin operon repressor/biotin-[acetyl-CoA-carboxylase] ligase
VTVTTAVVSRLERFGRVGSTNDVVRGWLAAGEPEVCIAIAEEQTAGRGRDGRTWVAPPGAGLLMSIGFRPTWLDPDAVWRLPAIVSLAMAEAAEAAAGLGAGTIRLKWPNDLVIEAHGPAGVRKLGGVLGETSGLGTPEPTAIVGIGINADWPRDAFPAELADTMTSLRDASAGRPIDRDALFDDFAGRLEEGVLALRTGAFDAAGWEARQVTTGNLVEIHAPDGRVRVLRATGVDSRTGALLVDDDGSERPMFVGEIRHVRLAMV